MLQGLLFITLTSPFVAAQADPAELLIGNWYTTRGRTSATVTFDRDGRIGNRIVSPDGIRMRSGFYKLDGNKLTATLEENQNTTTNSSIIKELTQNRLVIEDADGTVVFRRRSGPR